MRLVPIEPPGRLTRKARDFEAEIVELRAQGYTLQAIRQALVRAGVNVSISTVRREANRHAAPRLIEALALANVPGVRLPSPPSVSPVSVVPPPSVDTAAPTERRSGKDIAEAFMEGRITNPLFRNKDQR